MRPGAPAGSCTSKKASCSPRTGPPPPARQGRRVHYLRLILRNALRHKLRTALTVFGLVVAILSFGLLQTVVDAWYSGANSAAPNRLVTRNAISLTFAMPLAYRERIRAVDGVQAVA